MIRSVHPGASRRFVLGVAVALGVLAPAAACSSPPSSTAPTSSSPAPAAAPRSLPAADALDRLDPRKPVPLLPMMANHQKQNMRDHLVAVREIVSALATADFAAVEKAAGRIGFSEQMGQMCGHMGAGAPGFSEQAVEFHHTADQIVSAARDRDGTRVLGAFAATLETCTSCHASWKQQVVDEPTWRQLTALDRTGLERTGPEHP